MVGLDVRAGTVRKGLSDTAGSPGPASDAARDAGCGGLCLPHWRWEFDYMFGRVASNSHNAARSNQLALEMKRLGVPDTPAGREILTNHFTEAARTEGNISREFSNQYGNFEVRDSMFIGPSGKAVKFETTFHILEDGTRRFSTAIPFRGGN